MAAIAAVMLIAACDKQGEDGESGAQATPLPTAATLGEQVVLSAGEYLATEPYAGADRARGEMQARVCRACHSFDANGQNMIGPALYGFFGRKVGSRRGFEYSPVMRNADFVWTPVALNAWLAQPGRFLPGNRMTFAGVLSQVDRDNLIAYLLEETSALRAD